jgi:hypothetical protein
LDRSLEPLRCVLLTASLRDGDGKAMVGAQVNFHSETGEFSNQESPVAGEYPARLCTGDRGVAHVVATYDNPNDPYPAVTADRTVSFTVDDRLPQPGLNTAPYAGAGKVDGFLRVFALDEDTVGRATTPEPFPGVAYVLVEAGGRQWSGTTGAGGFVEFSDPDLKAPVDVTVGAPGHRWTTYLGESAINVAVAVMRLDPVAGKDDARTGAVEGTVIGFEGEGGLPAFPPGGSLFSHTDEVPIAIVSLGLKNVPLSSISMGNILQAPDEEETGPVPIPSNMVLYPSLSRFRIANVPEGQYLLFALGGMARGVVDSMADPYFLDFSPRALAITRIAVKGGQVTSQDLRLEVDLLPVPGTTAGVNLGNLPVDALTGKPFPNGLVMPVMDTGGEGYVFVDVDGSFNRPGFVNPIPIRFPLSIEPHIASLGLSLTPLAVGLAAREAVAGVDPPGISTAVYPGVNPGDVVDFASPGAWLAAPAGAVPAPPAAGLPVDAVSPEPFTGTIEFAPVTEWRVPDLYVVRFNRMTGSPRNTMLDSLGNPLSIGGPRSHGLWEIFVPPDRTRLVLPCFPEGMPAPLLANPAPDPGPEVTLQHYAADTVEIELNAYALGAGGKPFRYDDDFVYTDLNLHASGVSQDSYLVKVAWPAAPGGAE